MFDGPHHLLKDLEGLVLPVLHMEVASRLFGGLLVWSTPLVFNIFELEPRVQN